jgi:hypothetical protein
MKLLKKLHKRIADYCETNPQILDFAYDDKYSKEQIITMLESEEGLNDVENEIFENCIDWIGENEDYFLKNNVYEEFEDELTKVFLKANPKEDEHWIEAEIKDFLVDNFRDYTNVYLNMDQLIRNTGKINCLIKVYSNYDCTNSFDTMESSEYLSQVYDRVKAGVKKEDFIWEHQNGAYGGCLFCFAFNTDLKTLLNYKAAMKTAKKIKIPKGTQFGFFSDFQGSGSCFEKLTYKDFYLNIQEEGKNYCKYDSANIVADCEQSYTMDQVYGGIRLDEQTLKLK